MTPTDMVPYQILNLQIYKKALNTLVKNPAKFIDGMNCAIYHKPHTFVKCPILKDVDYLRKQFIQYCLLMNCTQKQMVAAVNCTDASWTDNNVGTGKPDSIIV